MKRRILAVILAILMLVLALSGCGSHDGANDADPGDQAAGSNDGANDGTADAAGQEKADRSLSVGVVSSGEGFDRTSTYGYPDYFGLPLVFDCLFSVNPDTGECDRECVESFEWLDELHINITLKDGIFFSDGTQMTGEDVIATMYRFIETGGPQMTNFTMFDFDNCVVDEENPLNFTLAYHTAVGMGENYLSSFEILPKSFLENADADAWRESPVGSGPYRVTKVEGSTKVYERRDDYWNTENLPEAETITVTYYTDQTTLFVDFLNGAIDIAINVSESDMREALAGGAESGGYTAVVQPDNNNLMLVLCDYVEAFSDINVRQTIAHAIDKKTAGQAAYGSLATPSKSMLPSNFAWAIESAFDYDPELSRQLLADAGYSDGDISFKMVCTNGIQTVNMAEAIQGYLAAIGIEMSVESYDVPTAVGMWIGQGTDLLLQSKASLLREPYQIFEPLRTTYSNPASIVADPTFNEYLEIGATSIDQSVRREAYENAQKWNAENYWVIPICDINTGVCYNARIASCNTVSPLFADLTYVTFAD